MIKIFNLEKLKIRKLNLHSGHHELHLIYYPPFTNYMSRFEYFINKTFCPD